MNKSKICGGLISYFIYIISGYTNVYLSIIIILYKIYTCMHIVNNMFFYNPINSD